MKYSWEFKLECINKYKNGEHIIHPGTPKQRKGFMNHVRGWVKNYDDLGVDGLKHSSTNKTIGLKAKQNGCLHLSLGKHPY